MKPIAAILLILLSFLKASGQTERLEYKNGFNIFELNQRVAKLSAKDIGNLDFLKKFNGKYPYQVKLLDHPKLKERLKKMLGSQYDYIKKIWEVGAPMEINKRLFYAYGGQAHSGGETGVILMADIENNVLFVGIRNEGKEEFYSEKEINVPKRMQEWANEQ